MGWWMGNARLGSATTGLGCLNQDSFQVPSPDWDETIANNFLGQQKASLQGEASSTVSGWTQVLVCMP